MSWWPIEQIQGYDPKNTLKLKKGRWRSRINFNAETRLKGHSLAVYSTFFVAAPGEILSGFPGWKMPLEAPVQRVITDFFGRRTIETREPDWDEFEIDEPIEPELEIVSGEGDYAAYLEGRLPPFVRAAPHWCAKGLTNVELDSLGELTDGKPALVDALFAPPSRGAQLLVFRESIINKIRKAPQELGHQWAARMSTPDYTHSVDGSERVNDDWSVDDAISILMPLVDLSSRATRTQRLYVLMEW